jgi:hypothetical protein
LSCFVDNWTGEAGSIWNLGRAGFRDFSIYVKGRGISRILRENLAQMFERKYIYGLDDVYKGRKGPIDLVVEMAEVHAQREEIRVGPMQVLLLYRCE